ncbi:DUF3224 domain-containing protein [Sphingomonas oligophenolica]|uniref:DUF3224 domain-containing protein n=2 Tax=Sphingomonas oligophenolica TaxID=301154 RepID=A0A502CV80_9SPHN|nr:DUF3224 domain-containing protein [Sphingomonas oligophenolica]
MHAIGTFTVEITPEAQADAPAGGLPTARMGIAKTFTGGMTGTATGTMLSAGAPKPGQAGAYVAVDQFTGTVDGHGGGFALLHRGTIDKAGTADLSVVIAPDTGTGALAGIAGTFGIEIEGGVHRYDLTYTLPAKP